MKVSKFITGVRHYINMAELEWKKSSRCFLLIECVVPIGYYRYKRIRKVA